MTSPVRARVCAKGESSSSVTAVTLPAAPASAVAAAPTVSAVEVEAARAGVCLLSTAEFMTSPSVLASARAEGLSNSATADASPAAPTSPAAAAPAVAAVEVEAARACACLRREGHLAGRTPMRAAVLVQRRRLSPLAVMPPPSAPVVPWRLVMVAPSPSPVIAAARARPPVRLRWVVPVYATALVTLTGWCLVSSR